MSQEPNPRSLDIDRLKFYGRTDELATTRKAFVRASERVINESTDLVHESRYMDVVLVRGPSGSGKSAFVRKFCEECSSKACFVHGKFHHRFEGEPYAAFASAFRELVDFILKSERREEILRELKRGTWREERVMLTAALPCLSALFPEPKKTTAATQSFLDNNAFYRFQNVVRNFIRNVCATVGMVVLVLDDLHWADAASLELIHGLVNDHNSEQFLFVGTYRDVESPDVDLTTLSLFLETIREEDIDIHDLKMRPFDQADTMNLVVDALGGDIETSDAETISELVFEKSNGNVLFSLYYLRLLQSREYITFSEAAQRWEWTATSKEVVERRTPDHIVAIVVEEMERLPTKVQNALMIASCFNSEFRVELIQSIEESMELSAAPSQSLRSLFGQRGVVLAPEESLEGRKAKREAKGKEFDDVFRDAIKLGLIEGVGKSHFRFTHDVLQKAAYDFIGDDRDARDMHLQIGRVLYKMSTDGSTKNDEMILVAVNQLNRGSKAMRNMKVRRQIAELNFQAAQSLMVRSAFTSAMQFLHQGLELLGSHKWEAHYPLALKLSTLLAEMYYTCCEFVSCKEMVDEVVQHARRVEDKFGVYYTLVQSLGSQGRIEEAIDTGLGVLKLFGVKVRHAKLNLFFNIFLLRFVLSKKSVEGLSNSKQMSDDVKLQAVRLLRLLAVLSWMTDRDETLLHLQCKVVRLSLRHGASAFSAFAFASMGTVLCAIGDLDAAYRVGSASLKLAEKFHPSGCDGLADAVFHYTVNHWRRPFRDSLKPLLSAYQRSMGGGDIEAAFYSAAGYFAFTHLSGTVPLRTAITQARKICQQMKDFNHDKSPVLLLVSVVLQTFLNFAGESRVPWVLSGEAIHDEAVFEANCVRMKHIRCQKTLEVSRLQLAYHFGNIPLAHAMAQKHKKVEMLKDGPHAAIGLQVFYSGMTAVAMCKSDPRRHRVHMRDARRALKTIRRLMGPSNANGKHYQLLLEAEIASADPKRQGISNLDLYTDAISACADEGFTQFQALANEKAAEKCLDNGDTPSACEYMVAAKSLYLRYGAVGKSDFLKERYPFLFYDHATVASSGKGGGSKGRRFVQPKFAFG